jgi:hypothetical protein
LLAIIPTTLFRGSREMIRGTIAKIHPTGALLETVDRLDYNTFSFPPGML